MIELCALNSAVRNPATSSGQAQPTSLPETLNTAAPNWPQAANQAPPRPGPTPAAGQPVGTEMNPTPGAQRALAWTGHLEWQDTVSKSS